MIEMIKEYVDLELFAQSRKIELAIKNHSCAEALAWCKENGSSLKKIKVYFSIALDSRNKSTRNIAKSLMYDVRALWSSVFDSKNSLNLCAREI